MGNILTETDFRKLTEINITLAQGSATARGGYESPS